MHRSIKQISTILVVAWGIFYPVSLYFGHHPEIDFITKAVIEQIIGLVFVLSFAWFAPKRLIRWLWLLTGVCIVAEGIQQALHMNDAPIKDDWSIPVTCAMVWLLMACEEIIKYRKRTIKKQ